MIDFGALPPEVNSARMYAGPGAGPLLVSAAAWDALGAELESFATGYSATLAEIQGQRWSGAASDAMAAAAAPYVQWVTTTASQAEDAAGRARAAAAAYEAAFAATVPPAVVTANRTLLAVLLATNFFGQNTSAIAATEAEYAEMWAQDAAAMYVYGASASAAAALNPFDPPPQTTNPGGVTPVAVVGQAVSSAPQSAASATSTSTAITTAVAPIAAFDYGLNTTILGFEIPKTLFQGGSYFLATQRTGTQDSDLPVRTPIPSAPQISTSSILSKPVVASTGRSVPVGGMSVPQNWPAEATVSGAVTETAAATDTGSRILPPWAHEHASAGVPATARISAPGGRRQSNAVFRMQDHRYRVPRHPMGG